MNCMTTDVAESSLSQRDKYCFVYWPRNKTRTSEHCKWEYSHRAEQPHENIGLVALLGHFERDLTKFVTEYTSNSIMNVERTGV